MAMIKYNYKAVDEGGKIFKGKAEVQSEAELVKGLKNEGKTLLSAEVINEKSAGAMWEKISTMGTVTMREKILFARNLASMVDAGLSVSRALAIMQRQTKNPRLRKVLQDIDESVRKGSSLPIALGKFPRVFPPLMISMVQSGEESGNLAEALNVVGEQMDKTYLLMKKVKGAMIYPGVIVVAMIIIGICMLIFVVPTLTKTFTELQIDLPASTRFIIGLSDFVQNSLSLFVLIIVGTIAAIYFGMKTRAGKKGMDWFVLHMPVMAPIVKEINSARTARTLSSLLSAGVPFVRALQIVKEVVSNSYYQKTLDLAEKNIQLGLPISKVFRESEDLYPIFVSEMMVVGEETGELGKMLFKVASFYEEEVDQKTKNMSTVIEPFLMVVVGIVVGFFALSMIAPMYSLADVI